MRMLRDWGQEQRYHHMLKGFNYRMDGIQGAILRVKLRHLADWTDARRAHGRALYAGCWRGSRSVTAPVEAQDDAMSTTSMPCAAMSRDALQRRLQAMACRPACTIRFRSICRRRIGTSAISAGDFPQSEAAARTVLSLPIYPELQLRTWSNWSRI